MGEVDLLGNELVEPGEAFQHDRVSDGKDEWLTPPWITDALGPFDLDPCSPVKRPWPTATRHYTVENDGRKQPWAGRVWLNPPYGSETGAWLRRLADHGDGIALVFARTDTNAWHDWVLTKADSVLFIRGRLCFHHVDGHAARSPAGAPSALVAYGSQNSDKLLAELGHIGHFVRLK